MSILYKRIPKEVYDLITDKQNELRKKKQRVVSQSEAMTELFKEAFKLKFEPLPSANGRAD